MNQRASFTEDHDRLRALLDSAVDGIVTIDDRGVIEAVNPAAEKLFGYSTAELVGRNVSMLMPAPYANEHDQYIANYLNNGVPRIIGFGREVEGRRKDGTSFPVYLAVSEVSFGHRRTFTGFLHDLSALRQAEQQATQLGRILEDSLNEIFVFDAGDFRIMFLNRGALQNTAMPAEDVPGKSILDIAPSFTQQSIRDIVEPLNSGGRTVVQFETELQRADGSQYNALVRMQKTVWEGRQAFVAIVLDTTEQHRIQQELAKLNRELEERVERRTLALRDAQEQLVRSEKLSVLGQLAGGVAHEIRNPLGVIRNSVYYLRMVSDQLDEDGRECIEEIEREVATANRIVSELLDFTREPQSHRETFPISDALSAAISSASVPEGVTLSVTEPAPDCTVQADRGQVERILVNLIRNAYQALGGTGCIEATTMCDDCHVTVSVADEGPGIAPENIMSIFEPLFTTKAKGIGLGLAVSQRYAVANGGCLSVESEPGKGTVFHLKLPRCR